MIKDLDKINIGDTVSFAYQYSKEWLPISFINGFVKKIIIKKDPYIYHTDSDITLQHCDVNDDYIFNINAKDCKITEMVLTEKKIWY